MVGNRPGNTSRVESCQGNTYQDRKQARGILSRVRICLGILLRVESRQGNTVQGKEYAREYFSGQRVAREIFISVDSRQGNTSQVRIGQGKLLRVENRPGNTSQGREQAREYFSVYREKVRGILFRVKIMPGNTSHAGQREAKGIFISVESRQGNISQGREKAREYCTGQRIYQRILLRVQNNCVVKILFRQNNANDTSQGREQAREYFLGLRIWRGI